MLPQADGDAPPTEAGADRIGLVLAGGGARGAYEAGALSVLLPALEARGDRVTVIVGTSVGALNAAWLASKARLPVTRLVDGHEQLWREIRWEDVLARVWSARTATPVLRYLAGALLPGVRVESLLDSSPLATTIARRLDVKQLAHNVASGPLHAAAVVATSAATGRSVVFHSGGGAPERDDFRGIDYASVSLDAEHVLASAAIPGAFRAVKVSTPAGAQGWYVDGGTRLNTPIKPALKLGATRLIVVGLNATQTQVDHRLVPYVLVAPALRDRIGELATEVFSEHFSGRVARGLGGGAWTASPRAGRAGKRRAAELPVLRAGVRRGPAGRGGKGCAGLAAREP